MFSRPESGVNLIRRAADLSGVIVGGSPLMLANMEGKYLMGFRDKPSSGLCVHRLQPISSDQRIIGNAFPQGMKGGHE